MKEAERRKLIAADSDLSLKQIGFRDGDYGNVHDTYELNFRKQTLLVFRHYVQLSLEEQPLVVTVANTESVDISK